VSFKLIWRIVLLGLLLPFLYFGTASATFLFRLHAENSVRSNVFLLPSPSPDQTQRLVVFAPHPDDEALGCGGLIQQAIRAGAAVKVVMLTNGDGFRVAVERQFRALRVGPADYVRFAALRQQEARRALGALGVKPDDIEFLGYPDRGLLPLWSDHWASDRPFLSPYTQRNRSPYPTVFRRGAIYCGESLLEDIKTILRTTRPTDVYITHPSDDHPDHTAGSAFVTLALQQFQQEKATWAQNCRLRYYLIHRGDWPVPQGMHPSDQLVPPSEMAALDTRWYARPLSKDDIERKSQSILRYSSQTAVMKRFLVSFARQNELFGEIAPAKIPRTPDDAIQPDGSALDWQTSGATLNDPVNDNLLRDFQAGGDVQAVYACRDRLNLYLRLVTPQKLSSRIEFRIQIRYFGDPQRATAGGAYAIRLRPARSVSPPDIRVGAKDSCIELAIPLRTLSYAPRLALNIETSAAGVQIDRTGYRFLEL
jgi:LmbE family N-acetylglucosaminyl deacetylase